MENVVVVVERSATAWRKADAAAGANIIMVDNIFMIGGRGRGWFVEILIGLRRRAMHEDTDAPLNHYVARDR